MAFDKLVAVVRSGRSGMPASVSLSGHGGGRPACQIALSQAFAAMAEIEGGDKFDLLIGTGDEQGVVRLVRNKAGGLLTAASIGKGGAKFYCGHIERFGSEPQKKQFCAAEVVNADTVEITLPSWAFMGIGIGARR